MKKTIILILIIGGLIFGLWLMLQRPKQANTNPTALQSVPIQNTNTPVLVIPSAPLTNTSAPMFPVPSTNPPTRPASVDDDTWSRWLAYRQLILSINQPIEFYARVLDQNEQPIEGAELKLSLGRIEGMAFDSTNFSAWDPGKATHTIQFENFSDSNGWIRVIGTNGSYIEMYGLSKEGYTSTYPDGNFGGVKYEVNGERTPMIAIEMTNAWNPQKGVILHMRKIEK